MRLLVPPLCVSCRVPAGRRPLCPACSRALEWLPRAPVAVEGLQVWAPFAYEGPARAMVRRLKFHGAVGLVDAMAAAIAANAPAGFLAGPLVSVPGRRRGLDHAQLLARALAKRAGLPLVRPLERLTGARQVGRSRAERLRTPPRFGARPGAGAVVLVDDVVTTGATLGGCACALEAAGWTCRAAVAYARTPG